MLDQLKASSTQIKYANNSIEILRIQENHLPSLNSDNGNLMCRACHQKSDYTFKRKRNVRSTQEAGQTITTLVTIVSHCPQCGHYSTTLESDMVAHKHYSLTEIQAVLEGKSDYSLASERTRSYWRRWIRSVIATVVQKIQNYCKYTLSQEQIYYALIEHLKTLKDCWLRILLDLFAVNKNNLCTFILLVPSIIANGGKETHQYQKQDGKRAPQRELQPP
jgi:hypothetical protein